MKRLLSIALLIAFLTATVGVIATSYHCKMSAKEMSMRKNSCSKMDDSCCGKEVKLMKLTENYIASSYKSIAAPVFNVALFEEHISQLPSEKFENVLLFSN